MDEIIGGAVYYICSAFFMCILLKIDVSDKKRLLLSIVIFIVGFVLVIALCKAIGIDAVLSLLPITILLPLYLVFWLISVHKGLKLLFVLLTSSILMLLPLLLGVTASVVIDNEVLMTIVALAVIVGSIVLLIKFFRPQFLFILQSVESKAYWLSISVIPILYNVAVYLLGLYNAENGRETPLFFQLILMGITLAAYILIVFTFTQTRKRVEMEYDRNLTELQTKAAMENMERMQELQSQTAIYKHDMKHHIRMLGAYLEQREYAAMERYLNSIENELEAISLTDYCKNRTVNLLLSTYAKKAETANVELVIKADIPPKLNVSEKDICVVLSNALSNALNAVCEVEKMEDRKILFECNTKNNRLAFMIENHYSGEIYMKRGLPQSKKANHGWGTQSIVAITKKYEGLYSFEAKDGLFSFKLII